MGSHCLWKSLYFGLLASGVAHAQEISPVQSAPEDCQYLRQVFYPALGGPTWRDSKGWESLDCCNKAVNVTCDGGRVKEIYLVDNNLSGQLPEDLGTKLNALTWLQLQNNLIEGSLPRESLGNLTRIKGLRLHNNKIGGYLPGGLFQPTLEKLSLNDNQLEGTFPTEVNNIRNISEFLFDNNKLSGVLGPATFQAQYCFLDKNQFSCKCESWKAKCSGIENLSTCSTEVCSSTPTSSLLPSSSTSSYIPTKPTDLEVPSTTLQSPPTMQESKQGLGIGAIVGIVIGVLVVIILVCIVVYYRKRQDKKTELFAAEKPDPSLDMNTNLYISNNADLCLTACREHKPMSSNEIHVNRNDVVIVEGEDSNEGYLFGYVKSRPKERGIFPRQCVS